MEYAEAQRQVLMAAVASVPEPLRGPAAEPRYMVRRRGAGAPASRRARDRAARGAAARDRARRREAEETEAGSLLHSLDHLRLTEGGEPLPAPEFVQPRGALTSSAAVLALVESRAALRAAVAQGDGLALGTISVPHVAYGPLTLYEWILFLGQHEARHAGQIREIGCRLAADAGTR